MYRPAFLSLDGSVRKVDRFTDNVEHAPERLWPDWNHDGGPGVEDCHPTPHPVGRCHRHRPHTVLTKVLFHLHDHITGVLAGGPAVLRDP